MLVLQVDTYEGDEPVPVVSHVFYGASRELVLAIVEAHRHTDEFFDGSFTGEWNGIPLHNVERWRSI